MQSFWLALQFLTRLPTPRIEQLSDYEMGRSLLHYPGVGALIGVLLWLTAWIGQSAGEMLSAALILAVWVAVTGALHLDGLADSVDAWVGGAGDRERTLAIMKDPCCGPMAVAALVVVLLLKFAALTLIVSSQSWAVLLVVPVLARAAVVALLAWTPYARPGGLGSAMSEYLPRARVGWVLFLPILVALLLVDWSLLPALAAAGLMFYLLRREMINRLGGTTGDSAGALIELLETVLLIALAWQLS